LSIGRETGGVVVCKKVNLIMVEVEKEANTGVPDDPCHLRINSLLSSTSNRMRILETLRFRVSFTVTKA
jgi:hypothetical protein